MSLERRVFVIHGRDKRARKEFYSFVRAIGLHPIEWSDALTDATGGAPLISDALDKAIGPDRAIIVLLTPDDITALKHEHADDADDPDIQPAGQARPNVLFEAGMAFGRYPQHTVVVEFGKVRRFTDLDGRYRVRLDNSAESRNMLAQRLRSIGCDVDLAGSDWVTAGDLTPPTTATSSLSPPVAAATTTVRSDSSGAVVFTSNVGKWRLELGGFQVNPRKQSPLVVHGEVMNRHGRVLTLVLKATLYAGDRIVGSADGVVNDLAEEERRAFELTTWDELEEFSRVHVHVDTGFSS
ncbi:TIR domain-containing protein [Amycolatopsis sp. cmx-4-68]|uniref:TIR domain-containing protein n=1 Tax=Amycolatopsis sp. cmx-4-68 TaxID=2790938 RepID=UPI0039790AF6